MEKLYGELMKFLRVEDKENSLKVCMEALENSQVSILDLYESILSPALNSIVDEYEVDLETLIWKEHVRSGIIRTIVECSYPYVIKERDILAGDKKNSVIIMCPKYEEHELGARMATDFFTISGYNTTFIGANTPENTILKAIETIQPKYICISVTNPFNLVATKQTIEGIKEKNNTNIQFILGGYAFSADPHMYKKVGGHILLKTFKDILDLGRGVEEN